MVRLKEEKSVQLGKVTPTLNNALVDYAKLIGITKIDLIEELIAKELEGRVLNKGFIVPEKTFYFNMNELLEEGTVKASTNKPSNHFNKYYTVKKIANNLDSINAEFRTYCYNDNKHLHKGIFMFYFFTYEANPVPLVFDYNIETNELVISVVKLSELSLLIDSEEDVATVEEILKTAKDNIETYSSLTAKEELDFIENPEDNFYIDFMIAISEVIEDFSGRKKIDLLVKYNVNEFDSSIDEDVPDLNNIPINKIDTEDLFKTVFEQERELIQLNKKLEVLNDIKEEIEDIKKWWIMEDSEKEELKAEIWKDIKK